ncbi:hypothetical protein Ancab_011612 [Ancistrocladus abbreviatus]
MGVIAVTRVEPCDFENKRSDSIQFTCANMRLCMSFAAVARKHLGIVETTVSEDCAKAKRKRDIKRTWKKSVCQLPLMRRYLKDQFNMLD